MCYLMAHTFSWFSGDGPSIHMCRSCSPSGRLVHRGFVAGVALLLSHQLLLREMECAWEKGRNDPVV